MGHKSRVGYLGELWQYGIRNESINRQIVRLSSSDIKRGWIERRYNNYNFLSVDSRLIWHQIQLFSCIFNSVTAIVIKKVIEFDWSIFHGFSRIFQKLITVFQFGLCRFMRYEILRKIHILVYHFFERKIRLIRGRVSPPFGLLSERLGGYCMRTFN